MRSPWMILGYLSALFGLSTLPEAPEASEGILEAPPVTVISYSYQEAPIEATTTTAWVEPQPKSDCEIALQLALDVGWPASEMATLANVLYRESRCTPDAFNAHDPMGGSIGYLQINQYWCKSTTYWPSGWLQAHDILDTCDELFNPETNLRAGLAIWNNSSWHPWAIK